MFLAIAQRLDIIRFGCFIVIVLERSQIVSTHQDCYKNRCQITTIILIIIAAFFGEKIGKKEKKYTRPTDTYTLANCFQSFPCLALSFDLFHCFFLQFIQSRLV